MANLYSEEDINFIKDNWKHESDEWMADKLGRTTIAIANERLNLRLIRPVYSKYAEFNPDLKIPNIQKEMEALVNFIEITKSPILKEIANTRLKQLSTTIKLLNR